MSWQIPEKQLIAFMLGYVLERVASEDRPIVERALESVQRGQIVDTSDIFRIIAAVEAVA